MTAYRALLQSTELTAAERANIQRHEIDLAGEGSLLFPLVKPHIESAKVLLSGDAHALHATGQAGWR